MTTVSPDSLQAFLVKVFEKAGTPSDIALVASEHLVRANLSGYDSHGVIHIDHYLDEIASGSMVPDARPEVISKKGNAIVVDAHRGWGLFAGMFAMEQAIQSASAAGIAAVSVVNCTHIGRLGHYVEHAAERGLISMVTWGAGRPITWGPPKPAFHLAVPYGGAAPALSTNPFAFGVPTGDDRPFVLDFATTVIANAKTWVYRERGESLPSGVALDKDGHPTTDPDTYMDGGMLLTFGGHKGYGISLLTCLLGGLTGASIASPTGMDGPFFLAMDPDAFLPGDGYKENVRSFLDGMNATPPASGSEAVLVPGDYESTSRKQRLQTGIELTDGVRIALEAAAAKYALPFDLVTPSIV